FDPRFVVVARRKVGAQVHPHPVGKLHFEVQVGGGQRQVAGEIDEVAFLVRLIEALELDGEVAPGADAQPFKVDRIVLRLFEYVEACLAGFAVVLHIAKDLGIGAARKQESDDKGADEGFGKAFHGSARLGVSCVAMWFSYMAGRTGIPVRGVSVSPASNYRHRRTNGYK